MNISELARRVRATPDELREKLPLLGFDVGSKAIKVDDRLVNRIMQRWGEFKRTERLKEKYRREEVIKEAAIAKVKSVTLPKVITVRDFAAKLQLPLNMVIGELMKNGILASLNERIDIETASIVAQDLGFEVGGEESGELLEEGVSAEKLKETIGNETEENLKPRPPVVVVMGHVDHGKTMLLDTIRKTSVVKKESGGITQHIGAYQAENKGKKITFIDTPGHEAFTVMRSRGARVADIAILVVAADDGVQPQTVEVIKIIEAAKLPYIVALNKIDKPGFDINRIKTQLAEHKIIPEEWGGNAVIAPVSAKTGQGIEELLDMIVLVADVEKDKIRANPDRAAVGTIIESHVDKGEGPVATVLVQAGTLKRNDQLAARGSLYGRVRAMKDWNGELVDKAGPGTPVKILGFKVAPHVGDIIEVADDAAALKQVRKQYSGEKQNMVTATQQQSEGTAAADRKTLNVVLKADVLGSLEALVGTLEKFQSPDVGVSIVSKGLGNINESDVLRAQNTGGVVMAFNVLSTREADVLAREKNVEILLYKVIYSLFDEVKKRLIELLPVDVAMVHLGKLDVLAVFRADKHGQVVGGLVTEGKLNPGANIVVYRNNEPVGEGKIVGLQSGKSDTKEVRQGQECGMKVACKTTIAVGDMLDAFVEERTTRTITF
jgi:translation initiation factor IF-2